MPERRSPQVVVITGMSGAGRSTAAKVLEDLGYFVVDNLPPSLITDVVKMNDLAEVPRKLAVVVDSRGGVPMDEVRDAVHELEREGVSALIVFLDADDEALHRRFEESRRPHPVPGDTLAESIAAERALLEEMRAEADVVIDTTDLNVHELRARIEEEFREATADRPMRVNITSFGFKHGAPRDVDLMFDVRFLPNPHWVPDLRPLTGTDPAVRDYVLSDEDARHFVDDVDEMLGFLLPRYRKEGKSYLSIGVGCTGGRHRSVAIAEELAERLRRHGVEATVRHRDARR